MSTPQEGIATSKSSYIPSLDGIRAGAFLLVFLFHSFLGIHWIPGFLGVTIFFFLSGYLITTLLHVEASKTGTISLKAFYMRRTLRILPPMYLVYFIAFVLGSAGILHSPGNLKGVLSTCFYFYNYATLLSTHFVVPSGLNVLWSIMVEEHFYLFFPFLYFYFVKKQVSVQRQSGILLLLCMLGLWSRIIVVYFLRLPQAGYTFWPNYATDCRFDSILWGCLLAIHSNPHFKDGPKSLQRHSGAFALGGVGLLLMDALVRNEAFRQTFRFSLDCLALYPIFYFCVRHPDRWPVQVLQWKPLRYLGWISFSMYLTHDCFLSRLHELYPEHLILDSVLAFCGALCFSWAIRITVELPFQKLRGRLHKKVIQPREAPVAS